MYNLPLISMALGGGLGYFLGGKKTKWAIIGAAVPLGLQLVQNLMANGNGLIQLPGGLPGGMELITAENGETVSRWRAPLITEKPIYAPEARATAPAPAPTPVRAPGGRSLAQQIAAGEFTVDTGVPAQRPGSPSYAEWQRLMSTGQYPYGWTTYVRAWNNYEV